MAHNISTKEPQTIVYEPVFFETALAAAIYKENVETGRYEPMFPTALSRVLECQEANGGWTIDNKGIHVGVVLDNMAGLYALMRMAVYSHGKKPTRTEKAKMFLTEVVRKWDPKGDVHLPRSLEAAVKLFEIIRQDGFQVDFPGRVQLGEMIRDRSGVTESNEHSLLRVCAEMGGYRLRAYEHSRIHCGINGSPSETALAVLTSKEDVTDLESYLSSAFQATNAKGLPSVYPMSLVEVSCVGVHLPVPSIHEIDGTSANARKLTDALLASKPELSTNSGSRIQPVSVVSDAIYHVPKNCLGISAHLLQAKRFGDTGVCEELERVLTDELSKKETHPLGKFDESCQILTTLLQSSLNEHSRVAMKSLFSGICDSWWTGKHNNTMSRSCYYAYMLFSSLFSQISNSETAVSSTFEPEDVHTRGPIIVTQMAVKTLTMQNPNGSWGEGMNGCLEETSLALLSLSKMISIPFLGLIYIDIRHAIERGLQILTYALAGKQPLRATKPSWTFASSSASRSSRICEAFVHSAIEESRNAVSNVSSRRDNTEKNALVALKLATFFHSLPNLRGEPSFKLKGAAIESSFYVQKLKSMRLDIFPPTESKEKDKYFHYIPIMWCIHNSVRRVWAPPVLIWDISVVSLFIFLVDEYMEGTVERFSLKELAELRQGIENMFGSESDLAGKIRTALESTDGSKTHVFEPSNQLRNDSEGASLSPSVSTTLEVLSRWAKYQMRYPSLQHASALDLHALHCESKNYLLYHLHQVADNQRLAAQSGFNISTPFGSPSMGYAPWLHTIGGGHIAATYALTWVSACLGNRVRGPGRDCFTGVKQKCMVWNANSHNAKELRMFNDFGSIPRDAEERNLNSTNFPEFFGSSDAEWLGQEGIGDDAQFGMLQRKAELLDAAQYERERASAELSGLFKEMRAEGHDGAKLADWFGLYFAGGNQFSDMYLFKDVTNSTK